MPNKKARGCVQLSKVDNWHDAALTWGDIRLWPSVNYGRYKTS